jgi:hypothetical protein
MLSIGIIRHTLSERGIYTVYIPKNNDDLMLNKRMLICAVFHPLPAYMNHG